MLEQEFESDGCSVSWDFSLCHICCFPGYLSDMAIELMLNTFLGFLPLHSASHLKVQLIEF